MDSQMVLPVEERRRQIEIGMWVLLGTIAMLFAAFSSAYLVRQAGADWHAVGIPRVLWFSTALLVASSITVEAARRAGGTRQWTRARLWLLVSLALGISFLLAQAEAWRVLTARGVYVATTPHASFLYVLSALHAAHILFALGALGAWTMTTTGVASGAIPASRWALRAWPCATFWHFLTAVWLYLFALLALV